MATKPELKLAKEVIDYLFHEHQHAALLSRNEKEYESLEELFPRPFVDSLQMESWIKEKYPELTDYYYGMG